MPKTAHRPFVDMTETIDVFVRVFVAGHPALLLIVRGKLDHAERHPRSRRDHPARMGCALEHIHIIARGHQWAIPQGQAGLPQQPPPSTEPDPRHPALLGSGRGDFQNLQTRFQKECTGRCIVYGHLQRSGFIMLVDLDTNRGPFFLSIANSVRCRMHRPDNRGRCRRKPGPRRSFKPQRIESQPTASRNPQSHLIITRVQLRSGKLDFCHVRPDMVIVTLQGVFPATRWNVQLINAPVNRDSQQGWMVRGAITRVQHKCASARSRGGLQNKPDRQGVHLIPASIRIPAGPGIQRPGQHAGPIPGRFG